MSEQQLRAELDAEVAKLNDKRFRADDAYDYELGEHSTGPAIDITKDGGAPNKVLGQFCQAAMRAGYIVSATMVHKDSTRYDYTRIFLHEADEHFDLREEDAEDKARAEGFGAGLFLGTTVAMEYSLMEMMGLGGMGTFEQELDAAADELVAELESLEGEGIEATMFEPMDGYEDGDVPRGE